ncbi:hypothetical protein PIB30_036937 [Stylosanthes scabra]|uniref:Uncharacterized protein n=1 Tax=Stylosanthes scabra TaxID=79078 RepID=A0ABU6TD99_9FABA|nr:hypothetical protein [Stylosanthes scabra]
MSDSNLIVGTLYPDGEMKRGVDGIEFACPNPILCYIQRVDTLDELKNFILRTMGTVGRKHAMFELHQRYDPCQVMELLVETRDVPICSEAGPSCTWAGQVGAIAAPPLRIATPDVSMDMDSGSDDGSDGDYLGESEESTDSFDEAEYVGESQVGRRFLFLAPAAIPNLASTVRPNPSMRRKTKGRPVSTRIMNEMDLIERQEKRCGICCQPRHTRRGCPNAAHPKD